MLGADEAGGGGGIEGCTLSPYARRAEIGPRGCLQARFFGRVVVMNAPPWANARYE